MGYQNNYRSGYAPVGGSKRYQQHSSGSSYGFWCKFIVFGLVLGLAGTVVWNRSNGDNALTGSQAPHDETPQDAWSNTNTNPDDSEKDDDTSMAEGTDDDGSDDGTVDDNYGNDADGSGGDENEGDDYTDPQQPPNDDATADDDDGATEEVLDEAVDQVLEDLEGVETKELETDEAKVTTALDNVVTKLRDDVLAFVGDKLSEDEVNSLTEEMEEHLREHVTEELEAAAKNAVVDLAEQVEGLVDGELEDGDKLKDIDSDLHQHEGEALDNLRSMIRDAEANIEGSLYAFALELEKDALEKLLSEKLGETVVLGIQNNALVDPENFLAKLGAAPTGDTEAGDSQGEHVTDEGTDPAGETTGEEPGATVDTTGEVVPDESTGEQVETPSEPAGEQVDPPGQVESESNGEVAGTPTDATGATGMDGGNDGANVDATGGDAGDMVTDGGAGNDSTDDGEGDYSTDDGNGDDSTDDGEGDDATDDGEGDDATNDDQAEGDDSTEDNEGDDNARLMRRRLRGSV